MIASHLLYRWHKEYLEFKNKKGGDPMLKEETYKILIGSKSYDLTIEEIRKIYRDMARILAHTGTGAKK